MQAEQRQRRRRRRVEGRPRLLLPVVVAAATGVCFSASLLGAYAFVPQVGIAGSGRRGVLRHGSAGLNAAAPPAGCSSVETGWQRSPIMVLGESPPATCQRAALQRAWRASSTESIAHEQALQQQPREEMDERGLDLRLTTFNLLAPCYKRMHAVEAPLAAGIADAGTGLLARRAKTERTARESEFAGLWRERAIETVDFIRREMSSSDIICLQEFWFDPEYETIFRSALAADYDFHTVKRTGGKSDGVAVLLRRGKWDVQSSVGLSLSQIGDRVALIMHLRSRREAGGDGDGDGQDRVGSGVGQGEDMILVNTHLAFPHSALDRANQMAQIEVVTEGVEAVVRGAGLPTMTPRVVVGDLNVEGTDQVCRHLGTNGFRSAFASLHREQRVITHRNHRGEEVMVDHVFVKAPGFAGRRRGEAAPAAAEIPGLVARLHEDVSVEEASLLPGGDDAASWNPDFFLSDHRPLTVSLKFPAD